MTESRQAYLEKERAGIESYRQTARNIYSRIGAIETTLKNISDITNEIDIGRGSDELYRRRSELVDGLSDKTLKSGYHPAEDGSIYRLLFELGSLLHWNRVLEILSEEEQATIQKYRQTLLEIQKHPWNVAKNVIEEYNQRSAENSLREIRDRLAGIDEGLEKQQKEIEEELRGIEEKGASEQETNSEGTKAISVVIIIISALTLGYLLSFSNANVTSKIVGTSSINTPVIAGFLVILVVSLLTLFKRIN